MDRATLSSNEIRNEIHLCFLLAGCLKILALFVYCNCGENFLCIGEIYPYRLLLLRQDLVWQRESARTKYVNVWVHLERIMCFCSVGIELFQT